MRIIIEKLTIDTSGGSSDAQARHVGNVLRALASTVSHEDYEVDEDGFIPEWPYRPAPEPQEPEPTNGHASAAEALLAERFRDDRAAMSEFVAAWRVGFGCAVDDETGVSEIEQPDRLKLTQTAMATSGKAVFAYIDHCGRQEGRTPVPPETVTRGLRAAVKSVVDPGTVPDGVDFDTYCDEIAGNIVQVASIVIPQLADTIEYTHTDSRG